MITKSIKLYVLLAENNLCKSRSIAKKIIIQGGCYIGKPYSDRKKLTDPFYKISKKDTWGENIHLWVGKRWICLDNNTLERVL